MNPSEFIKKFKSRYLWGNLCAMALVVVAACAGVKFGLDVYTHHGESIAIPDVRRKAFADADYLLREVGMIVVVRTAARLYSGAVACTGRPREVGTRDLPHRKRFAHAYALCARHHRQLIAA